VIQEVKDFTSPRAGAEPSRWIQLFALDRSTYSQYNSLPKWVIWSPGIAGPIWLRVRAGPRNVVMFIFAR